MTSVIRRLEFDAGHRLPGHEGKCRNVHGHRYAVEVECTADMLDVVGRVVDFGVVKQLLGGWIDDNLDHAFMADFHDHGLVTWLQDNGQRFYVFAPGCPPTAENLAALLLDRARSLLAAHGVDVVSVRVWETPNCSAVAR